MKKAHIIFGLFIVFTGTSFAQNFDAGKEIRKQYYPDKKIKTVCEYDSQGQLDGMCKNYDAEGALFLENTYSKNVQTGRRAFYPGGAVQRTYTYKNGKLEGPAKGYYENGRVQFEVNYVGGVATGISKSYYESGMLKSEINYKNGHAEGVFKQYYESGKIKFETTYKNGQSVGIWKEYAENGRQKQLSSVGPAGFLEGDIEPEGLLKGFFNLVTFDIFKPEK